MQNKSDSNKNCAELQTLGLDIGGANVKASDGKNYHQSVRFALWKHPDGLSTPLRELTKPFDRIGSVRVTMTGEIADGYDNKKDGVSRICSQVETFFREQFQLDDRVFFYSQSETWVKCVQAIENYLSVAAGNWNLSGRFLGRFLDSVGVNKKFLFLDLGSTTLDLLWVDPSPNWSPVPQTDWQRICNGNLLYQGCDRTPIHGVLPVVNFLGSRVPVAQELFATAKDAYLLTGKMNENQTDTETADGKPLTVEHSKKRLARLFCSDPEELPTTFLQETASQFAENQSRIFKQTISNQLSLHASEPNLPILIAGSGKNLLTKLVSDWFPDHPVNQIDPWFEKDILSVFPAYAAARLAELE